VKFTYIYSTSSAVSTGHIQVHEPSDKSLHE